MQDRASIAMSGACRSEMEAGHSVVNGGVVTATPECVFVPPPVQPQPQQPVPDQGQPQPQAWQQQPMPDQGHPQAWQPQPMYNEGQPQQQAQAQAWQPQPMYGQGPQPGGQWGYAPEQLQGGAGTAPEAQPEPLQYVPP